MKSIDDYLLIIIPDNMTRYNYKIKTKNIVLKRKSNTKNRSALLSIIALR